MAVELVRTIIRLEFAEALRPWLEVRGLFRVASGDENSELKGETTYFENEENRQRIGFQMRGFLSSRKETEQPKWLYRMPCRHSLS